MDIIAKMFKELFGRYRKEIPLLNHMTLEVSSNLITKDIYGWVHIGNKCESYNSMGEFHKIIASHREAREGKEILFRKF